MKKLLLLSGVLILVLFLMSSSDPMDLPTVNNSAFQVGEKLRYRITYGFVDAGEATLEVKSTSKTGNGRELFHAVGIGRTLGGFNAFYKVDDRYESYLDKKGVFPWFFVRRVDEGGYKINQDYAFKHHQAKVDNGAGKTFKVPTGVQDMISSFYYARTLNFKNIKKGKTFEFPCFMDDELYNLKIKYVGEEIIHIRKGKFKCMKFVPVVQTGRYFKSEEDVNFWVTSDANRIPVLVKAKIPVGIVKMHLVEWEGLRNELSSKLK
ncbi:MAG: DUF3108 domain-containing protein [Flavobacteriales bacterium]|jgi:hypothetical protein|nr:DUF3108 domain-containing protein [Flavobacteriales bacterium]NCA19515.1 DUF3108 domain-containing protein [Crocinitomicaceae bacterium]